MFKIRPEEIKSLQAGNIPESLDYELLDDIRFALHYNSEATIVFYASDDCTYAGVIEGEDDVFNDWGEEEGRLTLRRRCS